MIGAENVDKKRVQWIGNDFMFSKGHGDVAGSYIKLPPEKRIFIRQTKNYNEIGAINSISRMISNNKLILHNRANLLSQEMLSWQYKETVPEKEGFLLSRALCLTTASIHEVISTPRKEKILFPYSKERSEFLDAVERITKAGNLDREYNLKGIVTHR
jgi:hypothetical protein